MTMVINVGQKITDNDLKTLLASEIEAKKYDIDLACQMLELVNDLKNKLEEDFVSIDSIKIKLNGIEKVQFILNDLDSIKLDLENVKVKIEDLVRKITPKE